MSVKQQKNFLIYNSFLATWKKIMVFGKKILFPNTQPDLITVASSIGD